MKNALRRMLCLLLVAATLAALPIMGSAAGVTFKDVAKDFWGYEAISAAAEAGLVNGKSKNADGSMNYAPNDTMTRAEFLTVVLRYFYKDEAAQAKAGAKWWTGYYDLAKDKGVLKADELENGNLDKAMSREEMALVLYRTAPSMEAFKNAAKCSISAIPDYDSVGIPFKDAVLWVYGAGLIKGMDQKGTFKPQASLNRASVATILYTLLKNTPGSGVEEKAPTLNIADTLANRQQAMVETCLAYYYKNPYIQYDRINLSRAGRMYGARSHKEARNAPEYASEDLTIYSVCAAWAYDVIFDVFGYQLCGSPEIAVTENLAVGAEVQKDVLIYQYNNTGDAAADKASMDKYMSLLQPGDIITYYRPTGTGHTVVYVGDITGDGEGDILHCNGERYDIETGIDKKENAGGIMLNLGSRPSAKEFLSNPASSECLTKATSYSLIRVTGLDSAKYPLSDNAKTRLTYPGLAITYTTDAGFYGAAAKGSELTYTLKVKNNSKENHTGISVQIPVPTGATLVKVDGTAKEGSKVTWNLNIPAGETVVKTYTVKVTGTVGTDMVSTGGKVHGITLPTLNTGILSYMPDAAKMQDETARNNAAASAKSGGAEFVKAYYAACGYTVKNLPEMDVLYADLFENSSTIFNKFFTPRKPKTGTYAGLMVTDYYGGRNIKGNQEEHRVLETRFQDLMPGDVLYVESSLRDDAPGQAWVYDGKYCWAWEDGKAVKKSSLDIMKLLSNDLFFLIRPAAQ